MLRQAFYERQKAPWRDGGLVGNGVELHGKMRLQITSSWKLGEPLQRMLLSAMLVCIGLWPHANSAPLATRPLRRTAHLVSFRVWNHDTGRKVVICESG